MYEDRNLTCRDCGAEFVFSASEQEFFAEKGFTNDPGRCAECRAVRKQRSRSDGRSFNRTERVMYPAVCASCGQETEVPFEPRQDRPVYCRDCYRSVQNY